MTSTRNVLLVAAAAGLTACQSKKAEAPAGSAEAAVLAATAPTQSIAPQNENRAEEADRAPQPRKIIRTGALTIEVDDDEAARSAIDRLVRGAGGYVSAVEVGRHEGAVGSATLTLRVPQDHLDGTVAALSQLGTLRRESIRAEDVIDSRRQNRTSARRSSAPLPALFQGCSGLPKRFCFSS